MTPVRPLPGIRVQVDINYSRAAKQVDVRVLKELMWAGIHKVAQRLRAEGGDKDVVVPLQVGGGTRMPKVDHQNMHDMLTCCTANIWYSVLPCTFHNSPLFPPPYPGAAGRAGHRPRFKPCRPAGRPLRAPLLHLRASPGQRTWPCHQVCARAEQPPHI